MERLALCVGLLLLLLVGPAQASPSHAVLGPDASTPVRAWTERLSGLSPLGTTIREGVVTLRVAPSCALVLGHPDAPLCKGGVSVGNARGCWVGDGCPDAARRERALAAAGPLTLPWRQAGSSATADRDALLGLRTEIQRHLVRGDLIAARAALKKISGRTDVRPVDWLSLAPLLAWAGEAEAAWRIATGPEMAQLGAARLSVLRTLLLIGPQSAQAVAKGVMTKADACQMTVFAWSLLALRHYEAAGALGASVRASDPTCFDAYAIEAEAWTVLRRLEAQKVVAEAALGRFAGDPRLAPIEEAYLVDHGQGIVVQRRLEARIATGDAPAGVLKRLLSFYIAVEGRVARLKRFRERADADPGDVLANFFAGVLLHYEKGFEASTAYLERVIGKVSDEPRLYIYLAMNAFNLGDRPSAEDYITRAEALDLEDPDVPYCIAEIFRDSDRARANAAVDRYWEMTRFTSDINSAKQQRVWKMIGALRRCAEEDTPVPCPGPWEHTFDSVRIGMYPDAPKP